jgi:hypothetical protein
LGNGGDVPDRSFQAWLSRKSVAAPRTTAVRG